MYVHMIKCTRCKYINTFIFMKNICVETYELAACMDDLFR